MKAHILTLFPEMVREGLSYSITGRAMSQGLLELDVVNIRDYAEDAYGHVDDYPYGGGAGMVMKPGPVYDAYRSLDLPAERRVHVI